MVAQAPTVSDQALQQAELALQQNRLDEAEPIYRKLLEANYLPGVMHFRLGTIANLRGEYELALKEHREAFLVDPALAAKILPPEAPLRTWIYPETFDTVEVKQCAVCGGKKHKTTNVVNCLPTPTYHAAIDPIRVWVKCSDCGHTYPKERPSDTVLRDIYKEQPSQHLLIWNYTHILLASEILSELHRIVPKGSLLDVGTAAGVLPAVAKDFGYEATGMDIHPIYRENVERFGVSFIEGDFSTYDFGKQKFDIVTMGNVLERVVDVKKALKVLGQILNQGGVAWIATPHYDAAWTRIVGANDPMWLESEHIHYFSKASLERLLKEQGFKIIDYRVSKRNQGSVEVIVQRI